MKFKVGDRVKFIKRFGRINAQRVGEIYFIEKLESNNYRVTIDFVSPSCSICITSNLEELESTFEKLEEEENQMEIKEKKVFEVDGRTFTTRDGAINHVLKQRLENEFFTGQEAWGNIYFIIKNKEKILQLLLETMKDED